MAQAKSTDPAKVAAAMEGLKFKSFNGDVEMRKADHQLQQTLFITSWKKAAAHRTTTASRTPATTSAGQDLRAVHLQHADVVPDEAAVLSSFCS